MNPNDSMTPVSIMDYLMELQRQRQERGQILAQTLPPMGATAPALPPYGMQFPTQPQMTFPQASMPAPAAAPPTTETRTIGAVPPPAPGISAPRTGEMQGPLLDEMRVKGFDIGAGSFGTAQEYADRFAGGDLGKVKARTIFIDGQPVNDYYTKTVGQGLREALPSGGAAQAAKGGGMPMGGLMQAMSGGEGGMPMGGLIPGIIDDPKKFGGILGLLGLNSLFGG